MESGYTRTISKAAETQVDGWFHVGIDFVSSRYLQCPQSEIISYFQAISDHLTKWVEAMLVFANKGELDLLRV